MVEPKVHGIFYAKLVFKNLSTFATETLYFGNENFEANELYSSSPRIIGSLRTLSGFSLAVGETMPTAAIGGITIDDTRGSYGRDGKISDLLERSTLIMQSCEVYSFKKQPSAVGVVGDEKFIFKGEVQSVNIKQNLLSLKVKSAIIPAEYPTTIIDLAVYPNSASGAAGRYLPAIFGNCNVPAVMIDTVAKKWAYASTYAGDYTVGGVTQYYTTDINSAYVAISSAATTSTILIQGATSEVGASLLVMPIPADNIPDSSLMEQFTPSSSRIVTTGNVYLQEPIGGAQTYNCKVNISIYSGTTTYISKPDKIIGKATIKLTADAYAANQEKNYDFSFDKPIVFESGKQYFIVFNAVQDAGALALRILGVSANFTPSNNLFAKLGDAEDWPLGGNGSFRWAFYGVKLTDGFVANDSFAYFTATQRAAASGQDNPELSGINFIVDVDGFKDNGESVITGSASSPIDDAYDIARLVFRNDLTRLDVATFSASTNIKTTLPRTIDGFTKGRNRSDNILATVLRQAACKLVPRTNGKFALYPYGFTTITRRYLNERDVIINSIDIGGVENIVNEVSLVYAETSLPLKIEDLQTGAPRNFAKNLIKNNGSDTESTAWTAESFALYGDRPQSDGFTVCDFLKEDNDAAFLAKYYLTAFSKVSCMVEVELPFFESDYREIELMEIIHFSHPDLPAHFGTQPDSLAQLPVYSGATVETANTGEMFRRANSYDARVVGRNIGFNLTSSEPATITLDLKLLWNTKEVY